uniref:Uncharacterized protein n=1 Tax=Marmota marmota marmota TaxID=9994 RepID=A0A8C5ZCE0_MARMA
MVGRQEGDNHKKQSWLVLEAGPGRTDGPGDCKWRSDWKAVGSWKKRESPALFRPNTVEARSRSVGPPGSLVEVAGRAACFIVRWRREVGRLGREVSQSARAGGGA